MKVPDMPELWAAYKEKVDVRVEATVEAGVKSAAKVSWRSDKGDQKASQHVALATGG